MKNGKENKVAKYDVVRGFLQDNPHSTINAIADEVNKKIQEGWQPLGGVSIDSEVGIFYQAIVRYEED